MAKRPSKKSTSKTHAAKKAARSSPNTKKASKKKGSKKPQSQKPADGKGGAPKKDATPKGSESAADSKALDALRAKIDALDKRIVKMLNDRASLVVEVGKFKRGSGTPIYAPHREAQVLQRAIDANEGPLPDRTIEGVYRELMSGSFALERPLRIAYLGPPGSYSHQSSVRQFGSSVEYADVRTIGSVFEEVRRGHCNYGLVPCENSIGGGITETLDALWAHAGKVWVYAEVQIAVRHMFLSDADPKDVRRIHSKPEVFEQCRKWLSAEYPNAALLPDASTSQAVQTAMKENQTAREIGADPGSAAIASELAGDLYGLPILYRGIEDNPDNITRFYVLSKERARRTGDDKTAITFVTEDKHGALVEVLQAFHSAVVNLSHIDKRPSGRENWHYTFYVDALGHEEDESMQAALKAASAHCKEMHVLGSFPRSTRIL
jgi:chorismate mutase/prephenate dehydratase